MSTATPEDPSKEAQVQDMMAQIKALTPATSKYSKDKALPGGSDQPPPSLGETQEAAQAPPASVEPPATPITAAPETPKEEKIRRIVNHLQVHDVVEVVSKEGKFYGVLFKVGDIKNNIVHGYILKEHGGRDYITIPRNDVALIGESKVRSKTPCSAKWAAEHGV